MLSLLLHLNLWQPSLLTSASATSKCRSGDSVAICLPDTIHSNFFWNARARFSQVAYDTSEGSPYMHVNLSQAQDSEDIWAYENWFYGMVGGVILESGTVLNCGL